MHRLSWADIYSEAELYKAAVRLYTTPIFNWQKALAYSTDQKNFYDFARYGLKRLDKLHAQLNREHFSFREGVAVPFTRNKKKRIVYVYPWEERLVDLLLYRLLNKRLDQLFSRSSYAYRINRGGIDACQRDIERALSAENRPLYIIKRDISDYFNSINHAILIDQLKEFIFLDDYLFELIKERVAFTYVRDGQRFQASQGVPFGTAIACLFANIYLTELDRFMQGIVGLKYYRYSDDFLMFASFLKPLEIARDGFETYLAKLKLSDKAYHRMEICLSQDVAQINGFVPATKFKHLGLEFRDNGMTGLTRDKTRKICNVFRYALRRKKGTLRRIKDVNKRIDTVMKIFKDVLERGIRNVALVDYYLRHVKDEAQLKLMDRWLAEEALAIIFGNGHKKGNFAKLSFSDLRKKGLPSLVHRRKLILHRHVETSFFIWKKYKINRGTAARPSGLLSNPKSSDVISP